MPLRPSTSPSVVWSSPAGVLRCGPVTVELDAPPPVRTLHDASRVHWEPVLAIALAVIGGERRPLTAEECRALERWAHTVAAATTDARDGCCTLAVVCG